MNNYFDEFIIVDEELVDISSSDAEMQPRKKSRYFKNSNDNGNNNNNKKKAIIISTVAAVVAVAIGVTCFCLFFGKNNYDTNEQGEFIYSKNTTVSGLSISGKTFEQAKTFLTAQQESFIKPADISVDVNGEITQYTEADFKYTFNIDSVLNEIMEAEMSGDRSEDETYEITATPTDESVSAKVGELEKASNKEAKNATVSKFTPYAEKRFEYTAEQQGCKLDSADLSVQIKNELISGGTNSKITAKVETVDAKITVDTLKKNITKIASYETYASNTANALSNMKVALEACNGSVIEPGATWSFNECTGDSNLESNGYKSAGVIANGQMTQGIGGGLCQSSSTIYNAGLRANMTIEERHAHLWASAYVPTGLDATIDYPNLDLKMSNPTEYQMFLECKMVGSTLYVAIWGYQSPDYDEIKTSNKLTSTGGSSYSVEAYRIYYKDGKEVDREQLPSSTYDLKNGLVFNEADVDDNDVDRNVDDLTEPPTQKPTEPVTTVKPTQKPTQQSTTAKPTQKPTQKPTEATLATEIPVVTEPDETEAPTQTEKPEITEPSE